MAALPAAVSAVPISKTSYKFINYAAQFGKSYGTVEENVMSFGLNDERDATIKHFSSDSNRKSRPQVTVDSTGLPDPKL